MTIQPPRPSASTARGTALVTGATSGLGAEFAHQLASDGYNIVLVARDLARLEAVASDLRSRYGVTAEVLKADLTNVDERAIVEQRLHSADAPISYLVNNAGYGLAQEFESNSIDDEERMLEILATVPLRLSHAVLGGMLSRESGTVLTVASIAAGAPLGLYSAAKAWPLSFSRWANAHYRHRGVTFSAVAPGFVRTEFHARLGIERADMAPKWMWLDASFVVRSALRSAARGRAVSVPSVRYKLIWALMKVTQPLIMVFVARASRAASANGS
ncbi:SDR family NAD(P)-dependent oxidoreductase [Salinibacterium sp. NG253]|uniref:SDR family NAD(P)-dependent oxidoreductase n=1 Tax=Salinibacterium sp. NG253 TaxID=2792039 RepID=UPI0018CDEEC7|nr:SDR family NAD(P)-dependent oxidoreductase [Salinibacterium sp. NG253]MBH0115925.1 SDR family NAD(P)-dependent oxidoreductase [Salinibacterium sp. NG253]